MVEVDLARTEGIAHSVAMALARRDGPPDTDAIADAIADWVDSDRTVHLARFEITCAGGRDPRIRKLMSAGSEAFWRRNELVAVTVGSPDPARDGRVMVALLDGMIFDYL